MVLCDNPLNTRGGIKSEFKPHETFTLFKLSTYQNLLPTRGSLQKYFLERSGQLCDYYLNTTASKYKKQQLLLFGIMPVEENRYYSIVKDYIAYKLRQNNIFLAGYHENSNSLAAARHLRIVADELIEENKQLFDSMCDQLHLTPATTYTTFVGIADEIFQTGKNWGRIVAFLAFGATLAVYCAQREDLAQLINNIVEWVSMYMDQTLGSWIDDNGGWVRT